MKSGRYIGVMSGTSLDGVDVVLAAIDENMVAQQASLTWPIPVSLKEEILNICQGQQLTLSQLGNWMCVWGRCLLRRYLPDAAGKTPPAGYRGNRLPWADRLA